MDDEGHGTGEEVETYLRRLAKKGGLSRVGVKYDPCTSDNVRLWDFLAKGGSKYSPCNEYLAKLRSSNAAKHIDDYWGDLPDMGDEWNDEWNMLDDMGDDFCTNFPYAAECGHLDSDDAWGMDNDGDDPTFCDLYPWDEECMNDEMMSWKSEWHDDGSDT